MKVPTVFKSLSRTSSNVTNSTTTISRSSSTSSSGSLDSFDGLKEHLSAHRDAAAFEALKVARAAGHPAPQKFAYKAAAIAVAKETLRVQAVLTSQIQTTHGLNKARIAQRSASLRSQQADRRHGADSTIARAARQQSVQAARNVGIASAEAYIASELS